MQPVRTTHGRSFWKGIIASWDYFSNHVIFDVGIEDRIFLWHDQWCGYHLLKEQFSAFFLLAADLDVFVSSYLECGSIDCLMI